MRFIDKAIIISSLLFSSSTVFANSCLLHTKSFFSDSEKKILADKGYEVSHSRLGARSIINRKVDSIRNNSENIDAAIEKASSIDSLYFIHKINECSRDGETKSSSPLGIVFEGLFIDITCKTSVQVKKASFSNNYSDGHFTIYGFNGHPLSVEYSYFNDFGEKSDFDNDEEISAEYKSNVEKALLDLPPCS